MYRLSYNDLTFTLLRMLTPIEFVVWSRLGRRLNIYNNYIQHMVFNMSKFERGLLKNWICMPLWRQMDRRHKHLIIRDKNPIHEMQIIWRLEFLLVLCRLYLPKNSHPPMQTMNGITHNIFNYLITQWTKGFFSNQKNNFTPMKSWLGVGRYSYTTAAPCRDNFMFNEAALNRSTLFTQIRIL